MTDNDSYARWREGKLAAYRGGAQLPVVDLANMGQASPGELARMAELLGTFNMVIYGARAGDTDQARRHMRTLGQQLGLHRLDANLGADDDAITPLAVSQGTTRKRYIPYTDRAISWHTDGYYNPPERQIRGMALHCVSPSASGGHNQMIDPEIAYILVRDENPDFAQALMHPEAMTIPANEDAGGEIRPARGGPVFSFGPELHMRYTARTRSIRWRDDDTTLAAVACLVRIMATPSPYIISYRPAAGQGVICNNVLHNRSAFNDTDVATRLILRARYYDRVTFD